MTGGPPRQPFVEAPGKVFLAGEYSVLAGGWAVVSTLTVTARAGVVPLGKRRGQGAEFVSAILRLASPGLEASLLRRGLGVSLDLSEFYRGSSKMGVGSSAAGVAAVTGLARVLENGSVGRRDALARECASVHTRLQDGLGSGADAAACCRGGVIRFRAPGRIRKAVLPRWLVLVAVVLGGGGRTRRILGLQGRRLSDPDGATLANLEVFGEAADRTMDALERGDWHSLRLAVSLTAAAYSELGDILGVDLVTRDDAAVMRVSRRLGGISRPSGAGGGDLHLACFREPDAAARFCAWAGGRGYVTLPVTPDPRGVRLVRR